MPEVKSYKPGYFSWNDLATTDPVAAKKFYAEVLGWKIEDIPIPNGTYAMARVNGRDVVGIGGQMEDEKKAGIPSHWNCYVTVTDVDATVKAATGLGAKVLAPAMEVMDVGRMAVLADPSGAPFCLWQAKSHIGAGITGEPGTIAWNELETGDVDRCGGFYSKLFGWSAQVQDMGNMKYTLFNLGKDQVAGMMPHSAQTPKGTPSHWTVYFAVANCDAIAKKVTSLNGKQVVPPTDIPDVGRFAMFFDPQGAWFAILQPARR